MHIVTTAYGPVDHRQNSVTSFNQNIYSSFLSSVTESKRKYQRSHGKTKDGDIIAWGLQHIEGLTSYEGWVISKTVEDPRFLLITN
jgi:hypothetical protein